MNPNRIIELNWTPITDDPTITGYNVYLVEGAPENSTKTLLAFVSGAANNMYLYTGVEGTQYQFEVRSTDGVNVSAPLEIFWPNGTSLYTPTLITPDQKPMMLVRDTPYLQPSEYINYPTGLKLTSQSPIYTSGVLATVLQSASEEVNRYTHRHFDTQTIDEVHDGVRISPDYPKMMYIKLNEEPIQNVISVNLQVLQFFINFSLQYLQIFPDKGYIQLVPFLGGSTAGVPLPAALLVEGILAKVWVRYTTGFDVIPASIKMATALYATKMIGLQQNPVSAQSVKFGRNFQLQWDKDNDPLLQRARDLLDPYVIYTYVRP